MSNWPTQHDPTNPEATPDFDDWGWDDYWEIEDWVTWHGAMKAKYGLTQANSNFLKAWHEQGFGASPYNARTFNTSFRDYAQENGFYEGLFDAATGLILRPAAAIIEEAPKAVENVVTGVSNAASATKWIIPVVIFGVIGLYAVPLLAPQIKKAIKAFK